MKHRKASYGGESVEMEYESEIDKARKSLPVYTLREKLLETIRDNQVVVLVGETGCGKTT
jgi:HrpA-like RNA helicase